LSGTNNVARFNEFNSIILVDTTNLAATSQPMAFEERTVRVQSPLASHSTGTRSKSPPSELSSIATKILPEPTAPTRAIDEQRLLARVQELLRQGDIVGARIMLEYTMEKGNARAAFMLAETYDPEMLQLWQTFGLRGDSRKALELYGKAAAAGIEAAKARITTLEGRIP
jgi:hypothetical protein